MGDASAYTLATALGLNRALKTLKYVTKIHVQYITLFSLGANQMGDEGVGVLASALKSNETLTAFA